MSYHRSLVSFNAGEASPLLRSRSDLEKYGALCQRLENFLILPYGGVLRRPGTELMGAAKFPDKRARLIGFNFSTTTNFVLEFGQEYVRFWSNGLQVQKSSASAWVTATNYVIGNYVMESATMYFCLVEHTSGTFATDLAAGNWVAQTILEIVTPFQEEHIREIQYCQINDLLYLVHPLYYPSKITRLADDNWTWGELAWKYPPTLDLNDGDITLTPAATSGNNVTITASSSLFKSSDVGGWWILGYGRYGDAGSFVEVTLSTTSGNSSYLSVIGSWEFTTYGSWIGTVYIERLMDGQNTWETIRTYKNASQGERNVSTTGLEEKLCQLRITWSSGGAGANSPLGRIEAGDSRTFGVFKVRSFTSGTSIKADIKVAFWDTTATLLWAEAACSTKNGFFRAVSLHDSRLIFGGTRTKPLRLYGSVVDDFENFRTGSREDESFVFGVAANESNPINWLVSQQGALLVGNAGEEWTIERTDDTAALGPTNVSATRQSSYGSAYVQAKLVNEVVMFIQRQGKKIRELTFAFEKDGWVAPDLTVLANHITGDGVAETAFQQQPDAVYWIITSDGKLAGMTYERDQNVVGWHPHNTQGSFESVATIYGGSGADEVWFVTTRNAGGSRYIERMKPDHRNAFEDGDKLAWWYLDCAKRFVYGSPTTVVTGLGHLSDGTTVAVWADGAAIPDKVISGGQITLDYAATNVLVGLRYTSVVKPMHLEIPLQDGSTKSRQARIHRIAIEVYKSLGCEMSSDEVSWDEIFFRKQGDEMDDSPPVFTGKKKVSLGGSYGDFAEVTLRHDKPTPLCVLSITAILDFFGNE